MQIVLMRHGKPIIDKNLRVTCKEFGAWVEEYNAAGIDMEYPPSRSTLEQARRCSIAVCSDLPRSLESAKALGIQHMSICDSLFREMELPHAPWSFPRLSAATWTVLFRLAWMLGYSANVESFKSARERACHCAARLIDLAYGHRAVLLIGHGSLNWFIARHLAQLGWSCQEKSPRQYWEFGVYRAPAAWSRHPTPRYLSHENR